MRPSRFFVGRTTELQEIHEYFASHEVREDLACVVIHGLGGQGKTQTALAYCNNYRDTYDATFWINAETHEQINASLRSIAKELRSAGLFNSSPAPSPDGELSLEVEFAREWLEATSKSRQNHGYSRLADLAKTSTGSWSSTILKTQV